MLEILTNLTLYFKKKSKGEEYDIKVTNEEEINVDELQIKVKSKLEKFIPDKKDLHKIANEIVTDCQSLEIEEEVSKEIVLPLNKDEFLPWQESIMDPANPNSLATSISMKTINCPKIPAYAPKGQPVKLNESLLEKKSRLANPRSSIRGPSMHKARASMVSEMSVKADVLEIPKLHEDFYSSEVKRKEVDNHASWISFILFEETKRMERLAMLEDEQEDELSMKLRKRSTCINIATSASQGQNFTKNQRDNENEFIVYENKRYDRRRASSVIQKITSPMPKEIIECMKHFKTWNFDAFLLNELTSNNPLSFFMQYIYQAYGLDSKLEIDKTKFKAFIYEIQELYHKDNHYHNAIHASDVAQSVFYFLEKGEGNVVCGMNLLETISSIVGAAIHDLDHPGVNNYYLVNTKSPLAVFYNDKSVLENYHVACAFNLLRDEKYDIFTSLTEDSKKTARNIMVQTVLATDNAVHFEHLNKFKERKSAQDFDPKGKDKVDLLSLILHSADLSNPTRPLEYSKKWTMRVLDEFFLQGDKERELGLPISNLCDRYSINVAKSQIGFFDFFVKPFYCEVTEVFPAMSFVIGNVELNVEYWKTQTKRCEKELEELQDIDR
jgi:hypothetical protein